MRRLFAVLLPGFALATVGCGPASTPASGSGAATGDQITVNGQGATFVEPIMKVWTGDYADVSQNAVRINYQGTGSGAGITQMTRKTADFGCSDAPMNSKQVAEATDAGGPVVHVPLVIGAVVPMYNLPGISKPLTFTGPLLVDIFTGKVKNWNDAKIAAANPGVTLPALEIQPVYRADPSGTTFIFTDYLGRVSPEFLKSVGSSTAPEWPNGVGIKVPKSDGVAGHVQRNPGAIGYIELTYALDTNATYGSVVNAAGKAIRADLPSITAAAAAFVGQKVEGEPYSLHQLTYRLTDAPGEGSYPIAGMSFALLYQKQPSPQGRAIVEFLKWATSAEGQAGAKSRNYAPLPEALQKQCAERLAQVELLP